LVETFPGPFELTRLSPYLFRKSGRSAVKPVIFSICIVCWEKEAVRVLTSWWVSDLVTPSNMNVKFTYSHDDLIVLAAYSSSAIFFSSGHLEMAARPSGDISTLVLLA
jgi:hypothetical protein